MDTADRAWLAGLFEGEGCVSVTPTSRSVRVSIKMTDLDVIERVQELFPSPTGIRVQEPRWEPNRKTQYGWTIRQAALVREFLALIEPWLLSRRSAKVREALEYLDSRPGISGDPANRAKTHCPRGHEYAGDNLYSHNGKRHCRTCMRDHSRERMERLRADAASIRGPKPERWHGTRSGYNYHGCRCLACLRAAAEYSRAYRARRRTTKA